MSDPALPITANPNADLLRMLDGEDPPRDHLEAARRLGRDPSNAKRTVQRLQDDGLLTAGEGLALTDQGRRARRALDLAEGLIDPPANKLMVLWSDLMPHPDNPRAEDGIDDARIATLADTLESEGVLQDLEVTTPTTTLPRPGPVRLILIGHRRWLATKRLVEEGRWPADTRLPCTETADRPGLIFERSLVENGQRADLTNLEQAYAIHGMAMSQNLQAPRIAKITGVDLRTVQESLKVIREARAEDIAAHKAWLASPDTAPKFTWENLRDSVKESKPKPALDLTAELALVLVELAHAVRAAGAGHVEIVSPTPGGPWSVLRDRHLIQPVFLGDGKMRAALAEAVGPWLAEIGFYDDPAMALAKARAEVVGALQASAVPQGQYLTDWLNLPPAPEPAAAETVPGQPAAAPGESAAAADDLYGAARAIVLADRKASTSYLQRKLQIGYNRAADLVEQMQREGVVSAPDHAGARTVLLPPPADGKPDPAALYTGLAAEQAKAPATSAPATHTPAPATAKDVLDPHLALVMVELAHKLQHHPVPTGRDFLAVEVGRHSADSAAQALTFRRLLGFLPGPDNRMLAYPTPRSGVAWLTEQGLWSERGPIVPTAVLAEHQAAAGVDPADKPLYATEWLTPPPPEATAQRASKGAASTPPHPEAPPQGASKDPAAEPDAFARQLAEASAEIGEETAAEAEARLILGQVLDVSAPTPQLLRALFEACGVALPLGPSADNPGAVHDGQGLHLAHADTGGALPDALAEARARLLVLAVNAACGLEAE